MDYKLSETVIANIVQLLQLSMVTGTDISDQFRLITLRPSELSDGKLDLAPEYAKGHEDMIAGLVEKATELSAQLAKEAPAGFAN